LAATLQVDPGNSLVLPAEHHVAAGGNGRAWLRSSEPLGVVVDEYGLDMLATFSGVAQTVSHDAAGRPGLGASSHAAFGPLLLDPRYAWDTEIEALNLSSDRPADVLVEFLDAGGGVLDSASERICSHGAHTFILRAIDARRSERVGSVRVTSRHTPGEPESSAAPISAMAVLTKYADANRSEPRQRVAYGLLPEAMSLNWPSGGEHGGLDGGIGVVAVPTFNKDLNYLGLTYELSIANLVQQPGWTDVVILLHDQNAMVNALCRRLGAGEVEYIDLQVQGAIANGFASAALVSATYWEHSAADASNPDRNLVGLAAALVTRSRTRQGQAIAGDEAAVAVGVPLRKLPGAIAATVGNPCAPEPEPAQRPATHPSVPLPGAQSAQVYLPVMAYVGADAQCTARIEVTNEGDEPTKMVLLAWGEPGLCPPNCSAPIATCSGLIAHGESWSFTHDDLPGDRTLGAVVYSLSTRTLDEIGLEPGSSELVADRLCSLLTEGTGYPSCGEQVSFRRAFNEGLQYHGIPMDRAAGQPIAAEVERGCPDAVTAGQRNTSTYAAPSSDGVFATDPLDGTFWYSVSAIYGDYREHNTLTYVQNAGTECASVTLRYRASGDCLRAREGRVWSLAPGETTYVDPNNYVGPQYRGFMELHSDQPLAVIADILTANTQLTFQAASGRSPFDINGDGTVDGQDVDAMESALGSRPDDPDWNARADLFPDGHVDDHDRDYREGGHADLGPACPRRDHMRWPGRG
jgi:hypothetical protein